MPAPAVTKGQVVQYRFANDRKSADGPVPEIRDAKVKYNMPGDPTRLVLEILGPTFNTRVVGRGIPLVEDVPWSADLVAGSWRAKPES